MIHFHLERVPYWSFEEISRTMVEGDIHLVGCVLKQGRRTNASALLSFAPEDGEPSWKSAVVTCPTGMIDLLDCPDHVQALIWLQENATPL